MYEYTWAGHLGKSRNEIDIVSTVPSLPIRIGRNNPRALSVASSELVYTAKFGKRSLMGLMRTLSTYDDQCRRKMRYK